MAAPRCPQWWDDQLSRLDATVLLNERHALHVADAHRRAVAQREVSVAYWARHCDACGRALSDPDSIARGVGPCCAERLAGVA